MIIIPEIVKEFEEHGLLSVNLRQIKTGYILMSLMNKYDCSLDEALNSIKMACKIKIDLNEID